MFVVLFNLRKKKKNVFRLRYLIFRAYPDAKSHQVLWQTINLVSISAHIDYNWQTINYISVIVIIIIIKENNCVKKKKITIKLK